MQVSQEKSFLHLKFHLSTFQHPEIGLVLL